MVILRDALTEFKGIDIDRSTHNSRKAIQSVRKIRVKLAPKSETVDNSLAGRSLHPPSK